MNTYNIKNSSEEVSTHAPMPQSLMDDANNSQGKKIPTSIGAGLEWEDRGRYGIHPHGPSSSTTRSHSADAYNPRRGRIAPGLHHSTTKTTISCPGRKRRNSFACAHPRAERIQQGWMKDTAGTLSSPNSPQATYTEHALAAWRAVVADFNRHYKTTCMRRQHSPGAQNNNTCTPAPGTGPIRGPHLDRDFWAAMEDFHHVAGLYLELVNDDLNPRERARCMNKRTHSQKNVQEFLWQIPTEWTGVAGDLAYTSSVKNKGTCSKFPLSRAQHREVVRTCYYAVDEVQELVDAVVNYNRAALAHHNAIAPEQLARSSDVERHRLWEAAGKAARNCERVAHMPLYLMLDDARDDLCQAMGFDSDAVPKSFRMTPLVSEPMSYDEDETVESEVERPSMSKLGPRRLDIKILALQAQFLALQLSLGFHLRLGLFPARTVHALERMMEMLEEMIDWATNNPTIKASSRGRLEKLRGEVVGLLERTVKSTPEILSLLDSEDRDNRQRRSPTWRQRTKTFFKTKIGSYLASHRCGENMAVH